MTQIHLRLPYLWRGAVFLVLCACTAAQAAQLQPETVEAFKQHVAATMDLNAQSSRDAPVNNGGPFLRTAAGAPKRQKLRDGEISVNPQQGQGDIPIEKGIIHHWIGGVFVPGRTAGDALNLLRDFDSYEQIYGAAVEESKVLGRQGEAYRTFLRLRQHRIVTVVLNSEYDVAFEKVDEKRWYSRSVSTRIAQVKNPGGPGERELPVGEDSGYLWRIVTLWRMEEADGGVYLECEVIGLTRGVPYGFGWLVRPIIRSFPRESLSETLSNTRNALLSRDGGSRPGVDLTRVSLATGIMPSNGPK
ncbi:MAG: hypothetical protein WD733_22020 [Bryobacterales bacterium]